MAVVIVIGLVIAGVAANEDGTASDAEDRPTGTTSAASGELTYAETQFLRGVSPLVKRYATDEEILRQADYICSELESGDTSDIQTALVVTATQWATWTGGEAPTRDGSSYSFSEELATDALGFMLDTEDAFCPGAFPDLSGVAS
ncbi:hypothetical protein A606_05360 [Corynebacterium terpenotabidum Y-11]|uniref:DUF732 domain-containing protein n=1 Tax=Corynebacterium terpenotabidum Y-11 TaxID=1200352 RepID=S4XDV2_9CORY|nr:hypothetical protein A606_05360 [Corynebacterium terpenotabidum Y-11]